MTGSTTTSTELIDEGHDPGCDNPAVSTTAFPAAGETPVAVRLVTKGLLVNAGSIGRCASDFDGIGYAVIKTSAQTGPTRTTRTSRSRRSRCR